MAKMLVYLADLTHTRQTIALNTMPYPVGCLVSYAKQDQAINDSFEFRIFKYPQKLLDELMANKPSILCFSNYCWNLDISYTIAEKIKQTCPETVIIFGGPNYPTIDPEQEEFLKNHPAIDFYCYKESELAFAGLLKLLMENQLGVMAVKKLKPSGVHFIFDDRLVAGEPCERIKNLDEIPSPYTTGLLDEFFDSNLIPIVQTNRGCPFACTFCVEGLNYYSKVNKKSVGLVEKELQYIAGHLHPSVHDLHITDSNFGMYKEDEAIGDVIAAVQAKHNWPLYIHVATGKNQKERVLRVAKTINGALRLAGSVQSLTESVLENIKRANISADGLMELAKKANELGANSYSEIILALPGETLKTHFDTIEMIVNSGFRWVRIYQLMMLMGVEMSERTTREKFQMKTRYRVLPRCFGDYKFGDETIVSAEIEEICISTKDLSFEEYLESRIFHLTVETFYSDSIASELLELLKMCGISVYQWLKYIHDHRDSNSKKVQDLYRQFYDETRNELWESKEELQKFAKNTEAIKKYISGDYGSNLIFRYKAISMTKLFAEINAIGFRAARELIGKNQPEMLKKYAHYIDELERYAVCKKSDIFNTQLVMSEKFDYDFKAMEALSFKCLPENFSAPDGIQLKFVSTNQQMTIVDDGFRQYGTSTVGISRMLSKVFVAKLYREVSYA